MGFKDFFKRNKSNNPPALPPYDVDSTGVDSDFIMDPVDMDSLANVTAEDLCNAIDSVSLTPSSTGSERSTTSGTSYDSNEGNIQPPANKPAIPPKPAKKPARDCGETRESNQSVLALAARFEGKIPL